MGKDIDKSKGQPLRLVAPKLYQFMMEEFANEHIHPYDIVVEGKKQKSNIVVTIRYGQGFLQTTSKSFSIEAIEKLNEEVQLFVEEFVETCQETMKADYFKLMAP